MEAQHAFDPDRWTPRPIGLGIDRLDHGHSVRPWHHAIHLVEELLTAGGLAILLKRDLGKRRLLHGCASSSGLRVL